jgi:hypothetical protein
MRSDGRTLWRARYQSFGVSYNWTITMKYNIQNNLWIAGLPAWCPTCLLELVHGMWTHRNSIDNVVDEQGLPVCVSVEIETSIHDEFCKGMEGLA